MVDILEFGKIVFDMFIIVIEILEILKDGGDLMWVLDFELGGELVFGEERVLNELMFGFDFFMDLFGEGVFDGGQFGVDVDDLVVREG